MAEPLSPAAEAVRTATIAQQQLAPPAPAPAGSLLEVLEAEGFNKTHGRAVIRAVADWLDQSLADQFGHGDQFAARLRQEADR